MFFDNFTRNPDKIDREKVKRNLSKIKREIDSGLERQVTKEQFTKMTWEEIEPYIKANKNGELIVFGKELRSYWLINTFWNQEKRRKLEEYIKQKKAIEQLDNQQSQIHFLNDIINIWTLKAYEIKQFIWFKWARNDDNIIGDQIKQVEEKRQDFLVPISKKIFEKKVKDIFDSMLKAEDQEAIIGSDDMEKVKEIFLKDGTIEEKEIQIFNLMRYGGESGNSEGVKEAVAERILQRDNRFKDINTFLNNPRLFEILESYISFGDEESIELIDEFGGFGEDYNDNSDDLLEKLSDLKIGDKKLGKKLAFKLIKTKTQIEDKIERSLKDKWKENNKEIKSKGGKEITYEEFKLKLEKQIKLNTRKAILDVYKHILIRQKIESFDYRGGENESLIGLYANLTGLGTTSQSDYLTIADKHIDLAIDFAVNIAIGAITMGAGTLAIRGTNLALKTVKTLAYANKAGKAGAFITEGFEGLAEGGKVAKTIYKTGKGVFAIRKLKVGEYLIDEGTKIGKKIITVGDIGSFIGSSAVEGISFYEGATIASNFIFRENLSDWNKGLLDRKELIKNIIFMGTLNSLKFFSLNGNMGVINSFSQKIPKKYLEKESIQKVLVGAGYTENAIKEGSLMFGISSITDFIVGEGWHPSVKSYIEFIVLLQVMHLKDPGSIQKIRDFIKTHK